MSSDDVLTQAAQRLRDLATQIDRQAAISVRPGQLEVLERIAAKVRDNADVVHGAAQLVPVSDRDEVVEQWAATWDGVDRTPLPERPQPDALTDTLREAFNTAYERSDNPRVDTMHRHDQHQYAGACHVCRGDVAVLVPHIADRLISAGLVRTPVTAEQIEAAARELHRRDLGDVNAWLHEPEHRRDMWRSKTRTAAKALGLSEAEGGGR